MLIVEYALSCLATLLGAAFRAVCPTVKGLTPNSKVMKR